VPKIKQEEAVRFLMENAFTTPLWVLDPEILRRIEAIGAIDRIHNAQRAVMTNLLQSTRFARLIEQEAIDGTAAYPPSEFLATVRKGVWKELDAPQVKVDAYRRALQHTYLDLVNAKLNAPPAAAAAVPTGPDAPAPGGRGGRGGAQASLDEKPMYRAELRALTASVNAAIVKAADHETKAHLEGVRDEIARILDPKFLPPAPAAAAAGGGRGGLR